MRTTDEEGTPYGVTGTGEEVLPPPSGDSDVLLPLLEAQAMPCAGMTLRDWFAGMALLARLSRGQSISAAEEAYEFADAMLAERERRAG